MADIFAYARAIKAYPIISWPLYLFRKLAELRRDVSRAYAKTKRRKVIREYEEFSIRDLSNIMENSESGDDGGPLGTTAFLGGNSVSTSYIGVQSDDMEGRLAF